jgi:hypothetical protein
MSRNADDMGYPPAGANDRIRLQTAEIEIARLRTELAEAKAQVPTWVITPTALEYERVKAIEECAWAVEKYLLDRQYCGSTPEVETLKRLLADIRSLKEQS